MKKIDLQVNEIMEANKEIQKTFEYMQQHVIKPTKINEVRFFTLEAKQQEMENEQRKERQFQNDFLQKFIFTFEEALSEL